MNKKQIAGALGAIVIVLAAATFFLQGPEPTLEEQVTADVQANKIEAVAAEKAAEKGEK
jgi:hypothetical protein